MFQFVSLTMDKAIPCQLVESAATLIITTDHNQHYSKACTEELPECVDEGYSLKHPVTVQAPVSLLPGMSDYVGIIIINDGDQGRITPE